MSEQSESAARVITVALRELVRIAEEGGLPMLSYLLNLALLEAKARGGDTERPSATIIPFMPN